MRLPYRNKKATLWVLFCIIAVTMFLFKYTELRPICFFKDDTSAIHGDNKYVKGDNQQIYPYNRNMPLIFIGGVPRSGTTLMRAMLDAHPDVRCGQETRVIPRILQLRSHWLKSERESVRLVEAGITKEVMNSAIAQFCLEIIVKHGEPAPRLCNKDPFTLKMGSYVIELFPNAKFLFMVRDGRATVHSIISRKVTISGFDLTNYRQCMQKWNHAIEVMYDQCKDIGKERCMMVYYEQLVLHPEAWLRRILQFLDIPWNEAVLHHEEFINKPNGVPLSKVERSSDQVIKPVNLEALSKWVGHIPDDVIRDMADIAPMLSILGYDPFANPPDYGKPDAWVQDNTFKLKVNQKLWEYKAKQVLNKPDPLVTPMKSDEIENTIDDNMINEALTSNRSDNKNTNKIMNAQNSDNQDHHGRNSVNPSYDTEMFDKFHQQEQHQEKEKNEEKHKEQLAQQQQENVVKLDKKKEEDMYSKKR